MKSTNPETPLIEIIEVDESDIPARAKFKGKWLHPEVVTCCFSDYLEVAMPAEYLFDFTAGELPQILTFAVTMSGECLGLLNSASVIRNDTFVKLEFHFMIEDENPPMGDLNPFVLLSTILAALKKEGYKIKTYEHERYVYTAMFEVPFGDNVYTHYEKYLAALEKLCVPIEEAMIELMKMNWKKKLAKRKKAGG